LKSLAGVVPQLDNPGAISAWFIVLAKTTTNPQVADSAIFLCQVTRDQTNTGKLA
jgi:hypothetical protein